MRPSLIALLVIAACSGKKADPGAGTGTGTGTGTSNAGAGELARCLSTLERAATLPPVERGGAIVRGCGLCARSWDPLIAADRADTGAPVDLEAVWAVVEACGGTCSNQSAGAFKNALTELMPGKPSTRPWRALADACPKVMHTDKDSERFASGAWYALATIGDKLHVARAKGTLPPTEQGRLDAALAAMLLPLPPFTAPGTSFIVPGGGLRPGTPWLAVTVTADAVFVGRLAFARLSPIGLELVDGPVPYPGDRLPALAELPAALDWQRDPMKEPPPSLPDAIAEPVLVAPRALPARRLLAVVASLGKHQAHLAVAAAAPAALWRGLVAAQPMKLAAVAPVGRRLRVGLTTPRIAVVEDDGRVVVSAPLPVPDRPMVERWTAALNAVAQGRTLEIVAEDGQVDALAQLLDAAAGGAAAVAVPAPEKAALTGKDIVAFDDVKLKAALDASP